MHTVSDSTEGPGSTGVPVPVLRDRASSGRESELQSALHQYSMLLTWHLPWAQQWLSGNGLRVQEAPSTAAVHMPGVQGETLCHTYPWAADFKNL